MATMLEAAVKYARAGIDVFPVVPGEKLPAVRNGFKAATTDLEQIRQWWGRIPNANIAVPTGVGGFDVLDIDNSNSGRGWEGLEKLKKEGFLDGWVQAVETPSGGLHLYYPGTVQRNFSLSGWNIDFRGQGGYVLAPPSIVAGEDGASNTYTLLRRNDTSAPKPFERDKARNFLAPPTYDPIQQQRAREWLNKQPLDERQEKISDNLTRWVRQLPEGNRQAGLFWAACRFAEHGISDVAPLVDAAIANGLEEREVMRTVACAAREGGAPPGPAPPPARNSQLGI